ncbi:MAG: ABC transporter permease [Holosporales bacterium]|jgi:phospholipid/cholesterol/gamma-HCH transport system permease protein|nr:ABC transporter permease [Holosporales bacterium]
MFLEKIGQLFISFIKSIGKVSVFLFKSLFYGLVPPFYWKQIRNEALQIGYFSLPVVGLTAIFTGMAFAIQCYTGFSKFSAENGIPTVIMISMVRELGPVLTALMVAGRLGGSMTASIGTMRVTEQIDAITTLSVNPYKYLIFPKILAGIIFLPFLVFIDDIIGIFGGYLICVYNFGFNSSNYIFQTFHYMEFWDVMSGLIKGAFFGFTICLMGCYYGFHSNGGAEGVGKATTNSVVSSSVLILFFDYVLTLALF